MKEETAWNETITVNLLVFYAVCCLAAVTVGLALLSVMRGCGVL